MYQKDIFDLKMLYMQGLHFDGVLFSFLTNEDTSIYFSNENYDFT